jgi:hypothetical protein
MTEEGAERRMTGEGGELDVDMEQLLGHGKKFDWSGYGECRTSNMCSMCHIL